MSALNKILSNFHYFNSQKRGKNSWFITFEGIEGAGKSTLIKSLATYYKKQGKKVLCLREPGGTTLGEEIRNIILSSKKPLSPLTEAHLFAASRAQILEEHILPFLKQKNALVLLDRYLDSSLVYQGIGRKLGLATILEIHQHAPLNTLPDYTLYLKINASLSQKRQKIRGQKKDYFEKEKMNFTKRLIAGHEKLLKVFPKRIIPLPGERSPQEIFQMAVRILEKKIK